MAFLRRIALNLAVRYPAIYAKTAEEFAGNYSLTGVEVRPSPLSGTRNVVDCIFSYTNRTTDYTEKYFVPCDVTEGFRSWSPNCHRTMTVKLTS